MRASQPPMANVKTRISIKCQTTAAVKTAVGPSPPHGFFRVHIWEKKRCGLFFGGIIEIGILSQGIRIATMPHSKAAGYGIWLQY